MTEQVHIPNFGVSVLAIHCNTGPHSQLATDQDKFKSLLDNEHAVNQHGVPCAVH